MVDREFRASKSQAKAESRRKAGVRLVPTLQQSIIQPPQLSRHPLGGHGSITAQRATSTNVTNELLDDEDFLLVRRKTLSG
jgi:hypothetical protein